MKNLYNTVLQSGMDLQYKSIVNEGLEYVDKDYNKFLRDYKKFVEYVKDQDQSDQIKHALEQIQKWIDDLRRFKGLPASYWRYEQFTYAIATFDSSAREGAGGLYDKKVTDKIIDWWEKATGYKIKNQYRI